MTTTDKKILFKGIRFLAFALPLLFIGPVIVGNSFRNQSNLFFYPVFFVGILCCVFAIYFTFKGITTMVNAIFND